MNNEDFALFQEFLEFKKFKESQGSAKPQKAKATKKSKYTKRKDGRYTTTIKLGHDENGKEIKKTLYGKTIAELDAKVTEFKIEKDKGTNFGKGKLLFHEYLDYWWKAKELSINTLNTKRMYVLVFKYFAPIKFIPLKEVTSKDIQEIINTNQLHPRTCQQIKQVLNQIFEKAAAERIIYYNPVKAVVVPKYKAMERRPLTDDEDYLTELDIFTDRERAFILLLKYTGIRKGEALALTRSDFNLATNRLTISKSIAHDVNKPVLKGTKNGSTRVIPLPLNILPFITYYLSNLEGDKLFTNISNDEYITHTGYKRMWGSLKNKMYYKGAEIDKHIRGDLTAHIFRHNYTCMLSKANVDMKERQYLLGHSSIQVTLDIYTHIEEAKLEAPQRLNEYLQLKA